MRNLLEIELGELWVEGEVSNLRRQASGHCYFSLKDEGAQVSCVLFRGHAARAKAQPEDGKQVRVFGEVSVYEARGQVQLVVKQCEDAGLGDLQARFERLKKKLENEGLFVASAKKPLPFFPKRIALVTSPTGAALQDMLNVLGRRAPWLEVYNYPVQVQGKGAERGIARAIEQLGRAGEFGLPEVDVIIIGRGGGSLEDLWNFNEECVARAMHACPIPTISAVGHEIDFTIADFVADVRAPTPSAAAELAVPDREELRARLAKSMVQLQRMVKGRIESYDDALKSFRRAMAPRDVERVLLEYSLGLDRSRSILEDRVQSQIAEREMALGELRAQWLSVKPLQRIQSHGETMAYLKQRMSRSSEVALSQYEASLHRLRDVFRVLSPDSVLARGFSMTSKADGTVVSSVEDVAVGERITTHLKDGQIHSDVAE